MSLQGDRIRDARERKGLSQQDVADRLGVHRATVGNWESGKPPRNKLGAIREFLELDENLMPLDSPRSRDLRKMTAQDLIGQLNVILAELNALSAEVSKRLSRGDVETSQAPRHAHESPGVAYYRTASDQSNQVDYNGQSSQYD